MAVYCFHDYICLLIDFSSDFSGHAISRGRYLSQRSGENFRVRPDDHDTLTRLLSVYYTSLCTFLTHINCWLFFLLFFIVLICIPVSYTVTLCLLWSLTMIISWPRDLCRCSLSHFPSYVSHAISSFQETFHDLFLRVLLHGGYLENFRMME